MAKYVSNPVEVEAFRVIKVGDLKPNFTREILLEGGRVYIAYPYQMSNTVIAPDDYLVCTYKWQGFDSKKSFEESHTRVPEEEPEECPSEVVVS